MEGMQKVCGLLKDKLDTPQREARVSMGPCGKSEEKIQARMKRGNPSLWGGLIEVRGLFTIHTHFVLCWVQGRNSSAQSQDKQT